MGDHLPWFKVYAAETLSDERFSGWSVEERGAWFTLLLHAWREGSIPSDQTALARLLHVDAAAMRALWSAIGDRFVEHPDHPGRLTSPRLEIERDEAKKMVAKKKAAGKAGATSRWHKKNRRHGSRMAGASDVDATTVRSDGASGQHSAGQPQGSSSKEPPPPLPTKHELQANQAPRTQAVLEGLAEGGGWELTHAGVDKRARLEAAVVEAGPDACVEFLRADLADRTRRRQEVPGSIGFYLPDLVALGKRQTARGDEPPARPLAVVDEGWMRLLPAERRAEAQERWAAKQAEVERSFHPDAVQRVLAGAAELLRAEFLGAAPMSGPAGRR